MSDTTQDYGPGALPSDPESVAWALWHPSVEFVNEIIGIEPENGSHCSQLAAGVYPATAMAEVVVLHGGKNRRPQFRPLS
jgi:hypothetical protein